MDTPCLTIFILIKKSKYFLPIITYYPNGQIKTEKYFTDGERLIKEKYLVKRETC
jgi:antitoxin component YwqK of YwqJK toxin-antitoxin module